MIESADPSKSIYLGGATEAFGGAQAGMIVKLQSDGDLDWIKLFP